MIAPIRNIKRFWPVPVVLILWAVFLVSGQSGRMVDFQVNHKAAKRLLAGETLYPGAAIDGHYEFKYPPFAAILYIPLAGFPLSAAKALWALIVLSASAAVIGLSLRLARFPAGLPRWLSALAGVVLARFFLRELQLGQVNAVVGFLMLVGLFLLARPRSRPSRAAREGLAGAIWGLAAAVKIYPLIFLPYFLVRRKWRTLAWSLAVLPAAFVLPAISYGFSGNIWVHKEWLSTLSQSTPHLLASQDNLSLLAVAFKATGHLRFSFVFWALSTAFLVLVFLAVMARGRNLRRPEILEGAALMLLIPLISPLGWDYTFLLAALALTLCFRHFFDLPVAWRIVLAIDAALICLTLYDVLGRRLYSRFMSLSLPAFFFLVIFGFLAGLRRKRLA